MKSNLTTPTAREADEPAALPEDPPTATALKLFVVLARTMAALGAHAEADIARHGLTGAEFGILEALHHGGPMLLGDLQRRVLVSSGGTTFLVDRLTQRGLVERRPCATDRRARYAALTPEGKALMIRVFPSHTEVIRRAMSGLGLADQRKVTQLLRTLGTEAEAMGLPAK